MDKVKQSSRKLRNEKKEPKVSSTYCTYYYTTYLRWSICPLCGSRAKQKEEPNEFVKINKSAKKIYRSSLTSAMVLFPGLLYLQITDHADVL